jgi:capsular polysaccharide transport system permease protein
MAILQDTMAIVSYIESRDLVEKLDAQLGLRKKYSDSSIDYAARFNKDKPIEKFVEYWSKMARTTISAQAGIAALDVRAFSPQDAQQIAIAVLEACDALVNSMNERMYRDTVASAERDVSAAAGLLKTARLNFQQERNKEGILDVGQTGQSLSTLATDLETRLLRAQSDYTAKKPYLADTAAQMRILKSQMASLSEQLDAVRARMTSSGAIAEGSLSEKVGRFANLELEQRIAEKRLSAASAALDTARVVSERKLLYLHKIVAPGLPEEARYPRRMLNIGMVLMLSFAIYLCVLGIIGLVLKRMS